MIIGSKILQSPRPPAPQRNLRGDAPDSCYAIVVEWTLLFCHV